MERFSARATRERWKQLEVWWIDPKRTQRSKTNMTNLKAVAMLGQ